MENEVVAPVVSIPRSSSLPRPGPRDPAWPSLPRQEPGEVLAGAREVGARIVMPEKPLLSDDARDRARKRASRSRPGSWTTPRSCGALRASISTACLEPPGRPACDALGERPSPGARPTREGITRARTGAWGGRTCSWRASRLARVRDVQICPTGVAARSTASRHFPPSSASSASQRMDVAHGLVGHAAAASAAPPGAGSRCRGRAGWVARPRAAGLRRLGQRLRHEAPRPGSAKAKRVRPGRPATRAASAGLRTSGTRNSRSKAPPGLPPARGRWSSTRW